MYKELTRFEIRQVTETKYLQKESAKEEFVQVFNRTDV